MYEEDFQDGDSEKAHVELRDVKTIEKVFICSCGAEVICEENGYYSGPGRKWEYIHRCPCCDHEYRLGSAYPVLETVRDNSGELNITEVLPPFFIAVAGQTVFTLPKTLYSDADFNLYLNSALMKRGTDYIIEGNILTWLDPNGLTLKPEDTLIGVVFRFARETKREEDALL